ncbi:hypothetical protein GJU40_11245 [Bacillus lacus]|uniref:YtxH domain-containing protein n=1 Tax=Metabacillus lacus TaxID=1983721 RepID=A0A7X2M0E3_9BACI|nr:YtxH domain-containing protein [Metabacillus lacus]MRX72724.1 hypothetical protein [Metabacillus lacus]
MANNAGNKSSNKDFVVGTIVGGLLGAAAALFLAPKSGREMRIDLTEQANKLSSNATEKGNQIAAMAKEKTAAFTQGVNSQSSQVMDKVRDLTSSSENQGDSQDQVESAIDELAKEASESMNNPSEDQASVIRDEIDKEHSEAKKTVTEANTLS